MLSNKFCKATELVNWPRISTGCISIDAIIKGGVPLQGIVEIVGCSGVGKTQLCLQLSITTQLPVKFGGLEKGVVYICTEDVFPIKRLREMTNSFHLQYKDCCNGPFEDNIFVQHCADFEQLKQSLFVHLPRLLSVKKIGLVIIDSIAGVFRSENSVSYLNRSQDFVLLTSKLYKLATKYEFAVVCVNQVTDNITTGNTEPCLGLAWSNVVMCRFNINRYLRSQMREFEVIFAPDLPKQTCKFYITPEGLK